MKTPHFSRQRLALTLWMAPLWLSVCLPGATAQAPRAEPIPEEDSTPPRATPLPEDGPAPRAPEPVPEPAAETRPAEPAPAPETGGGSLKDRDRNLFDFCEMLFAKGDYSASIRQYEEYVKLFPAGRFAQEARFKIGEAHYRNKSYDLALFEFDSYLKDFPAGANRAIVLYHAGESHRTLAGKLGPEERALRLQAAEDAYRAALRTTATGPYACYAAFRLASFAYNSADRDPARYKDAIRYFSVAASQAPPDQASIKFTSLFFRGRSYRYTGNAKEATASFEEVAAVKDGNDRYEAAIQELASLDLEAGRQESAMKRFDLLARESAAAETRADSLVNTGMILADSGKTAEAAAKFDEALKVPGAVKAASRARYGLVFAAFKTQDYPKVIDTWRGMQDYSNLDEATRARMLLIVGTSYAATDQHARAADVFRILQDNFPDREEALEGGYKRLVSLFRASDPQVADAADDFAARWKESKPDSDFIDKAWLVKGKWYFNRSVWEPAARAYEKVRQSKLDPARLPNFLYEKGIAQAFGGDPDAIVTLTAFLEASPGDDRLPMALMQRGRAYLRADDLTSALRDFETILQRFPQSESAESAGFHAAKVKGMKQDYAGMVAGFEKLLQDHPKTSVLPEAHYWIGSGYYQLKKYTDCIPPLKNARDEDPKSYAVDASLMIIASLTALQEVDALINEVDNYLRTGAPKKVPTDVLRWLGLTLYRDRQDYHRAARFLTEIVNYDDPSQTDADLWSSLGECLLESEAYEAALRALDNHLSVDQRKPNRARTNLMRGRAYLALHRMDEATQAVQQGFDEDKETLVAAQLHMLNGDIAAAAGRPNEAISSYNLVQITWEDPTLTPLAIWKQAVLMAKDPAQAAKAAELRKRLEKYPAFQPPVAAAPAPAPAPPPETPGQ